MGKPTATATQAWIDRAQHSELRKLAKLSGRHLQEVTRRVIAAGLPIVQEAERAAEPQAEARA